MIHPFLQITKQKHLYHNLNYLLVNRNLKLKNELHTNDYLFKINIKHGTDSNIFFVFSDFVLDKVRL